MVQRILNLEEDLNFMIGSKFMTIKKKISDKFVFFWFWNKSTVESAEKGLLLLALVTGDM